MKALRSLTICMSLTCAIMLSAMSGMQSFTYEENPDITKSIIENTKKKGNQLSIDDLLDVVKKDNLSCVISMNVGCAAFFIHIKGDEFVIIDAGAESNKRMISQTMSDLLKKIFKKCILKGVVITHPDSDHYSLLKYTVALYCQEHRTLPKTKIPVIIGGNKYMHEVKKTIDSCKDERLKFHVFNSASYGTNYMIKSLGWPFNGGLVTDGLIKLSSSDLMFLTRSKQTYKDLDETRPTSTNAYSLICYIDGMIYTGDANAGTVDLRTGSGGLITTEDCNGKQDLDIGKVTSYDINEFYEKIKSVGGYVYGMVFPHHGSLSEGSRGVRNALLQEAMKLVFIPNKGKNQTQSKRPKPTLARESFGRLRKLATLHHTEEEVTAFIAVWSKKDFSYYPTVFKCCINGGIEHVIHTPLEEDDVKVVDYTVDAK